MKPCRCGASHPDDFYRRKSRTYHKNGHVAARKNAILRPCKACIAEKYLRKDVVNPFHLPPVPVTIADILRFP